MAKIFEIKNPDGKYTNEEVIDMFKKALQANGMSVDNDVPVEKQWNSIERSWDTYERDRKLYLNDYREVMGRIALAANASMVECDRLLNKKYADMNSPILNMCNSHMADAVNDLIDLETERVEFVEEYKHLISLDQTVE